MQPCREIDAVVVGEFELRHPFFRTAEREKPRQFAAGMIHRGEINDHLDAFVIARPSSLRAPATRRAPACANRISPVPPARIGLLTTPSRPTIS